MSHFVFHAGVPSRYPSTGCVYGSEKYMQSRMRSPVVRAAAAISNSPSAHPAPRPSLDHTLVHCDEQHGVKGQARAHGKCRACVRRACVRVRGLRLDDAPV